jgi:hypothetical protein
MNGHEYTVSGLDTEYWILNTAFLLDFKVVW